MFCVYRATFDNGKEYIGKTGSLHKRKRTHKYEAAKGTDTKFYRAIRKHGFPKRWSILGYYSKEKDALNAEIEFIAKFDSFKRGYNSTKGGDGCSGYKKSIDEISRWSAKMKEYYKTHPGSRKGSIVSKETREKLSKSLKGRISNRRGAILSTDSKNKMRKAKISVSRPIYMYESSNPSNAYFFSSVSIGSKLLRLDRGNLRKVVQGKHSQICGYKAEFV